MSDAAELKSTLEDLREVIPDVPRRFEAVVQQAGEIRQKASSLLETFGRADGQADELFEGIDAALKQLVLDVVKNREALAAGIEQIEQGVSELDAVERASETLKQSAEAAGSAMESFHGQLDEGIEAAKQAGDAFRAALEELRQETEESRKALSSALDTAEDAAESLQQAIQAGQESVTSTIETLAGEIKETQDQLLGQLESYLGKADELREGFTASLDDVLADVVKEPASELMEEMTEKISEQLKDLVDAAVGEVTDALDTLGQTVAGAKEGSAGGRGELEPLFEQLDGFMEPIKTVIDAIRDAAGTVGIDF